jgi:hypothetical protein
MTGQLDAQVATVLKAGFEAGIGHAKLISVAPP